MVGLVFGKDPSGSCVEKGRNVGDGVPWRGDHLRELQLPVGKTRRPHVMGVWH